MSADLDALDRGVIEAGVTAAEALARVAALETQVGRLTRAVVVLCDAAGVPEAVREASQRPNLEVVRP